MTPYEINVLLFYHTRTVDHEDIVRNPPIWRPTVERFIVDGLLEPSGTERAYSITARGNAYCESLCDVPLPESAWVTRWPGND